MDRSSRDTLTSPARAPLACRLLPLALAVVILAGCGSGEPDPGHAAGHAAEHGSGHGADPAAAEPSVDPSASTSSGVTVLQPGRPGEEAATGGPVEIEEGGFNHSDVAFVQMMIPHHGQALEMAELAEKHAVDPTVRILADRIRGAQGPEILAMSAWLEERNLDVPTTAQDPAEFDHGEHGHDPMMGMLTDEQMAELAAARGAEFDRLFLEGMIAHHEGALAMVDTVATDGQDVRVSELAADIDVTQRVEIGRMQDLLRS